MTDRTTRGLAAIGLQALALVLACALALAALAGRAVAADAPWLKERIEVFDDLVRLGDLFENAGDAANIAVFRSPDLGTEGTVSSSRVVLSAKQRGLEWTNPGGIERIIVRRPSRHITLEQISETLARRIARERGLDETATLDVKLEGGAKSIHLNPKVTEPFVVRELDLHRDGTFRAVTGIKDSDFARQSFVFHGTAVEAVEMPAPNRTVERGALITAADLETIRVPKSASAEGLATAPDELLGMAAKRRLPAGQPVRRSDVEAPVLIERNAVVTVLYQTPGMVLKTRGRATADGAHGETIPIVNLQTKRTLQARVISADTAVVAASPRAGGEDAGLLTGSIPPNVPAKPQAGQPR